MALTTKERRAQRDGVKTELVEGVGRPVVVEMTREVALILLDALSQGLDGGHGVFDEQAALLERVFDSINQRIA